MGIRVHLCGRLTVDGGPRLVDERELPGRQGRLALARLCVDRRHPVAAERLVHTLWPHDPPPDPLGSLASVISRLRTILRRLDGVGPHVIVATSGTYQLRLPAGASVDLEDARSAIDRAEGARRRGAPTVAWADATVATSIARRGFLVGELAPWTIAVQDELDRIARRGFDTLSWVWSTHGDAASATDMAEHAVQVAPLHEPSWRTLMATYAHFGNRADAVRAYRRCQDVLREQLGVHPDRETTALYAELLAR